MTVLTMPTPAGGAQDLLDHHQTVASCSELLCRFVNSGIQPLASGKIRFGGTGGDDVYNITAPFRFDGQMLIAGRVESRATEFSVLTLFRREADGVWYPCPGAPAFEGLQDPCVTFIGGELVLGGVRFPVPLADGRIIWRMEFFRGRRLDDLQRFLIGPDAMKDIRLGGLPDGRVAVFSRPQGEKGGRGKIGLAVVDSLDQLTSRVIEEAPLLAQQFLESEWGGANEAHLLRSGRLGVLGHIARFDDQENRHYYPMVFSVDPDTAEATPVRIFARRASFPDGPAKRPDLADVVFSGGLIRHWDGTATLFTGVSDAEAAWVRVPDPMLSLE